MVERRRLQRPFDADDGWQACTTCVTLSLLACLQMRAATRIGRQLRASVGRTAPRNVLAWVRSYTFASLQYQRSGAIRTRVLRRCPSCCSSPAPACVPRSRMALRARERKRTPNLSSAPTACNILTGSLVEVWPQIATTCAGDQTAALHRVTDRPSCFACPSRACFEKHRPCACASLASLA